MQVSQLAEPATYAIVGGGQARAFQIGQSAQAFKILSDTLYRDKRTALVREVLCNAVDAHIVAGIPDVPVEITLTDEELIIRDRGPGIADQRMQDVYCTYFGSTKQSDANQTGGFGLGSKAPFAYTDHFTVTSEHAGQKRIYALHVGDDANDGAPACRLMATVPTTETGLTVQVPLIETSDRRDFVRIIRDIVHDGGMVATLNGTPLKRRDYAEIRKTGFGLIKTANDHGHRSLRILYANVLYDSAGAPPVLEGLYRQLNRLVPDVFNIVLAAPPSSIGVTPSREGISYGEKTIETLTKIVSTAIAKLTAMIPIMPKRLIREKMIERKLDRLNFWQLTYHAFRTDFQDAPEVYGTVESMARAISQYRLTRDNPSQALLAQVAATLFSARARDLRVFRAESKRTYHYDRLNDQSRREVQRRILRFAAKFGVTDQMLRPGLRWNQLKRYADWPVDRSRDGADPIFNEAVIFIAPVKSAFFDGRTLNRAAGYLVAKPSSAELLRMQDYAQNLGIRLVTLEAPEKKPREKKPKVEKVVPGAVYRPLKPLKTEYVGGHTRIKVQDEIDGAPHAFLELGIISRDGKRGLQPGDWTGDFDAIDRTFGALGITIGAPYGTREADAMAERGIKRLEEWVLDAIEMRSPADRAHDATHHAIACIGRRHSGGLRGDMVRFDREAAYAAVGLPYAADPGLDRGYALWRAAMLLLTNWVFSINRSEAWREKIADPILKRWTDMSTVPDFRKVEIEFENKESRGLTLFKELVSNHGSDYYSRSQPSKRKRILDVINFLNT